MKAIFPLSGALILLMITANLEAASFDCRKATARIDTIICSNEKLSELDESLDKAYRKALARPDLKLQTITSQRHWLKSNRNTCKDAACLKASYETRIKELGFTASFGIEFDSGSSPQALPAQASATTDNQKTIEPRDSAVQTKGVEELPAVERSAEEADMTRSLTMHCDYDDFGRFQLEAVTIKQTEDNPEKQVSGKPASTRRFSKETKQNRRESFLVFPGQFAECIFSSGNRVRAKVGEGTAWPYGECGADPEVFMSLWVNERKIDSRQWFAGHCSENFGVPSVSYIINGNITVTSVQKCHTAQREKGDLTDTREAGKKDPAEPMSVCIQFPDINRYPKDVLEYPPPGTLTPKVGDIELLNGSDPVCQAVHTELRRDFHSFSTYPDERSTTLSRPEWDETSAELPKELTYCVESEFDFNNDKKSDRVFRCNFENSYMDGSFLLVQPGSSSTELKVSAAPIDTASMYLPFQMGPDRHAIRDYPPFSQDNDDAGFVIKEHDGTKDLLFRGRYSTVSPFTFQGTNYIAIGTVSSDTRDYVAVLKPLPAGIFQNMCLLRQVPDNF